jgi:ribosomal protein L27
MQEIARDAGAWRTGGALPAPGDMVLINRQKGGHFYTCTEIGTGPICTIESVDGGVLDGDYQAIAARRRVWTLGAGGRIVDTREGGGSYAVLGWVSVVALRW